MTVKQFFQSKTFKCIIVLLCIALVSGGLLAILNDLWAVSDEEIINRAISSLCDGDITLASTITTNSTLYDKGSVDEVYLLSDGNYMIKATGYEGFHSGTVSVYVLAEFDNGLFTGISNVTIAEYSSSQTLMAKFTEAVLAKFKGLTTEYTDKPGTIAAGATYSSNAVKNAVNCSITYINSELVKEVE